MMNRRVVREKLNLFGKLIKNQYLLFLRISSQEAFHKLVLLLAISLLLASLLNPRVGFQPPEYRAGAIATINIKANRDFLVEEKTATAQKRMEAVNEMPSVYDYDNEVATKVLANLNSAFSLMRDIIAGERRVSSGENKDLFSTSKKDFEGIVGISLTNDEFRTLYRNKFSPALAADITALITYAYNKGMITNVTFLQQEKDKGIIVRDVGKETEKQISDLSNLHHISDVEAELNRRAIRDRGQEQAGLNKALQTLAIKLIRPNLVYNQSVTETRRQTIAGKIKPVYVKVQKNEMLVREGEKITPAVLEKLNAYFRLKGEKDFTRFFSFLGMFLTIAFLGLILYFYAEEKFKKSFPDLIFIGIAAILQIFLVRIGIFLADAATEAFPTLPTEVFIYFVPFSVAAMLVSLLISRNMAFLLAIFLSILVTFLFDTRIPLFVYSFLGSIAASYRIVNCQKRTAFFRLGLFLGAINVGTILFFDLIHESIFHFHMFIAILIGLGGGIVSSLIVAGILPLFESLFQYTTDIKLLELANLNQPIFQKMIMEAPGTYHHSIIVASMVEAAAESIGANPLLAKVSAYYHDIGKMKKPQYFIENQLHSENKHDKLSPKMSSLVIISHVKDGYEMAVKAKLGKEIANIIREHHGTSLVSYFFEKAKKDKDPSIRALPETDFRYPGPKPQTREAGLVLLGDVLEASSRTLTNPTPGRIKALVRERIEGVFSDGQLDECELTLHDLNKMTESFTMILNGIFHQRIDYPEAFFPEYSNGARKDNNHAVIDRKSAEKNKSRAKAAAAISQ